MRLNLILPKVEPNEFEYSEEMPTERMLRNAIYSAAGSKQEDRGCSVPRSDSIGDVNV